MKYIITRYFSVLTILVGILVAISGKWEYILVAMFSVMCIFLASGLEYTYYNKTKVQT